MCTRCPLEKVEYNAMGHEQNESWKPTTMTSGSTGWNIRWKLQSNTRADKVR